jgi:hypothetical protein
MQGAINKVHMQWKGGVWELSEICIDLHIWPVHSHHMHMGGEWRSKNPDFHPYVLYGWPPINLAKFLIKIRYKIFSTDNLRLHLHHLYLCLLLLHFTSVVSLLESKTCFQVNVEFRQRTVI